MYYENTFSGSFTPGYLQKADTADTLFNADFETANLSQWTSNVNDSGDLSASDSADYWGLYGMKAVIDDTASIYVQDDSPNNETQYRARFYVNPNSVTMATGDILDIFTGRNASNDVLRIQLQKTTTSYQIRSGLLNDAGTWTDTGWYDVPNSWSAVEIHYQAFANSGSLTLWLDDVQKQNLTFIDNDTRTLTDARLGAQGVDTNTNGTVYFDDFESRRFSYIGTLTDPGVDDPQATNQPGWFARTYQYSATIPHAVTSVNPETGSPDTYSYDANGNMTCRVEGGVTFKQDYNAENRISAIHKMNGTCSAGSVIESWLYAYDGDGVRVSTAHYTGVTLDSLTSYYMGGAYEVTGSQVKKYYSLAGQTILRDSDGSLKYLLTDHLGSTSAVTDQNGTLLSQQRYLPFGEVRTDTNPPYITQTDFTYTGQRNLSGTGLMDYKARMYSQSLGRFIQPDSIIPNPANPQAFNRFSYVYNRPTIFTDPTGHDPWWCTDDQGAVDDLCKYDWFEANTTTGGGGYFTKYGVTVDEKMTKREKRAIMAGMYAVGNKFAETRNNGESASEAFTAIYDPFSFIKDEGREKCWANPETGNVHCGNFTYANFQSDVNNVVHELGHVFSKVVGGDPSFFGENYNLLRNNILRPYDVNENIYWQHHPPSEDGTNPIGEMFGDMFVAWVFDAWNTSQLDVNVSAVKSAKGEMNGYMSGWLNR